MPTPRRLSVLVVDDEPEVRSLLVEHFQERGHEVNALPDGAQAVSEITAHPTKYGIVISDLQLPGVDGLGVLAAAKSANPSLPVIIVTGHTTVDSAVRAIRLGAHDYLTKPFTLGQIEMIVNRAAARLAPEPEDARQPQAADVPPAAAGLADRLDAIERRLARIESALGTLVD
jgi:DNA-binding NtrC family response regulator